MTKTLTAQEFEIAFYEAMSRWVSGGKVGPDPRGEWESRTGLFDPWVGTRATAPLFPPHYFADCEYRWKQPKKRTVVIDGVELVAPEMVAPADDTEYYTECPNGTVEEWVWGSDNFDDVEALKNAKVFLTSEDCQAMADAQRKQRMGGAS